MAVKRPKSDDSTLVDYIIAHPEMSATACIVACGWKEGSVGKILKRIRPALDKRLTENSAKVDKLVVKTLAKFDAIQELADIARSWRDSRTVEQILEQEFAVKVEVATPKQLEIAAIMRVGKAEQVHRQAAVDYVHLRGQTPEARQILAEIEAKLPSSTKPDGDFQPEWATSVQ